ncbi:hypothetical protein BDF22DRAFT_99796 [Syncephalis plumigaleata]|nr:hypothetical protein BDF22DRAFT_99796 [Syncephalis plumigaleata]
MIIRLPTPETSAILNELLVPLQTAGHAFGDKIETTLGLFAHFPLEALPTTCQELIVNTVERRVTQILDTLSMMIIDNKSRKKDINAILALTIPVQCLANIIECTRSCAPLKNIDRVIKRIPQLLKECHICATEQPNRLVEVTHSIHALIVLATLVTGVTSTIACEILSFLTQWMTLDPTGLGKYYAIRFAGSCGEIQFQDVEKIKAFNLLSRLFAATWQTDSIFIRHETFTQFTRFATKTPHIDLTVRLAPAHIQEELASFMAKQATAFPPKQESNNKNLTKVW